MNNLILYNKAAKGGGIRCSISSSPKIINNIIMNNIASRLGGGIYFRVNSHPIIFNNTIVNNQAEEKGGGIFGSTVTEDLSNSTIKVKNTILWGNISPLGSQIGLGYSPYKLISVSHCVVQGGKDSVFDPDNILSWGESNIDEDPLLKGYRPATSSPCVDAGDNVVSSLAPLDFDGDDRKIDGDSDGIAIVDIGADELNVF